MARLNRMHSKSLTFSFPNVQTSHSVLSSDEIAFNSYLQSFLSTDTLELLSRVEELGGFPSNPNTDIYGLDTRITLTTFKVQWDNGEAGEGEAEGEATEENKATFKDVADSLGMCISLQLAGCPMFISPFLNSTRSVNTDYKWLLYASMRRFYSILMFASLYFNPSHNGLSLQKKDTLTCQRKGYLSSTLLVIYRDLSSPFEVVYKVKLTSKPT